MLTLSGTKRPEAQWKEINLGPAGSFEIELRSPTAKQLLADSEDFTGYAERRVTETVTGWRGIQDDSRQPVPFSHERLLAVFAQHPFVAQQVAVVCRELYAGLGTVAPKNFDGSCSSGEAADPSETQPSKNGSAGEGPAES